MHRRSFDTILSPEKQREELQRLAAEADPATSSPSSVSREKKEGEGEVEVEVEVEGEEEVAE